MTAAIQTSFRRTAKRTSSGFTLVELLVVIVIIILLFSTYLPSLKDSRGAAYQASCAQQLHKIGAAMNLFMADNGGRYPYSSRTFANGGIVDWTDLLGQSYDGRNLSQGEMNAQWLRYTVNKKHGNDIYRCPAETPEEKLRSINNGAPRDHFTVTYRINETRVGGSWIDPADGLPYGISAQGADLAASQVMEPSRTMLLTERRWINHPLGGNYSSVSRPSDQLEDQLANRGWTMLHGKGKKMNYLFADYHVETHEPNKTFGTGLYDNPRGIWTRRIGD